MAQSEIEWTDVVWNPTTGCNKVTAGCKNCYAEIMHKRLTGMEKMQNKYFRPFLDGAFAHEESLLIPMKWKKSKNIFVNSMSDLFHADITIFYIAKVYAVMYFTPHHTYQMLTKRTKRRADILNHPAFKQMVHQAAVDLKIDRGIPLQEFLLDYNTRNVWEGTSVENQDTAEERIPYLVDTPAHIRWLSVEPMLGPIDLRVIPQYDSNGDHIELDWIVVGGESGNKRRPFDPDWARIIRDYCWNNEIPFFMKQIDKKIPIPQDLLIREYPGKFLTA